MVKVVPLRPRPAGDQFGDLAIDGRYGTLHSEPVKAGRVAVP
jgi:uncharacterized protein YcsI (UPF0317 family)